MTPLFITVAIVAHIFVIILLEKDYRAQAQNIKPSAGEAFVFFAWFFVVVFFWVKLAFVVLT